MEFVNSLRVCLILTTLYQVSYCRSGFAITEISSVDSSKLKVSWTPYPQANTYVLDLRIANNIRSLPFIIVTPSFITTKTFQRLKAGVLYNVTVKAFRYFTILASAWQTGRTVPKRPKLLSLKSISSSTVIARWTEVLGADRYFLNVKSNTRDYNLTFYKNNGIATGLDPSTVYRIKVFAANAAGVGSAGKTRDIVTLVEPPSNIKITVLSNTAIRINWDPVTHAFQYEVTLRTISRKTSDIMSTKVFTNFIMLDNLVLCTNYTITIKSLNDFNLLGEGTSVKHTTEWLKPVQNVKVLYDCVADSVELSWNANSIATSYRAVATSIGGVNLYCTSSTVTCQITGLDCSEGYSITVMAQSDTCNSSESLPVTFETKPCTPQNFHVNRDCHSNTVWASWQERRGAFLYIVTALASDGTTDKCNTRGTSCVFTFFKCGLEYELKVQSISRDHCKSSASDPIAIRTAPCIPEGVKASTDCLSYVVTISWELALGAQTYKAELVGTTGSKYSCNASTTSCVISELQCGIGFIVFVIAYGKECDSGRSYYAIAETAPCTPSSVHTQLDCNTNKANITWDKYDGAIRYMVSVNGSDGSQMKCASVHTICWLSDLTCGQIYTATVIASNYMCNSSRSSPVNIQTAPCIPQNVEAHLDCVTGSASVKWNSSPGALSYKAIAAWTDGQSPSCNTQQTNCEIKDLTCSQNYTVSVLALNENCKSNQTIFVTPNTNLTVCLPLKVTSNLNCENNALAVSWSTSALGPYVITAEEIKGHVASYNTTAKSYQFPNLQCGEFYIIVIHAASNECHSSAGSRLSLKTVPCNPQNVKVQLDCNENTALVIWDYSEGALWYTAIAKGDNGNIISCSTSGTSCTTPTLLCGQIYSVHVAASDRTCNHSLSSVVQIQTAPCSPQNISTHLDCRMHITSVWWEHSEGAMFYTAVAKGMEGDRYSCNTTEANCEILGLPCGQIYTITVLAMDEYCTSLPSSAIEIETVPCIPQYVVAHINCENNTISVFWDPSNGSESYHVTAQGINGHWASCNTTGTECEVSDVHCGLNYYITVEAIRMECNSSQSSALTVKTVPCVPQNVDAHMDCDVGHMSVSWEFSEGAISYVATAEGSNVQQCSANDTLCDITDLYCGEIYTLSVYAIDDTCDSVESPSITRRTVSCIPQHLDVQLDCDTNDASVLWSHTKGAVSYSATAEGSNWHTVSCKTVNEECQITNLYCGQVYNVTLTAQDGVCDNSQPPQFQFCTAPCAPEDISTSLNCDTRSTSVAWEESDGAMWYITTAEGQDGHISLCNTTGTSCDFMDLHCSQTYSLTVTAMDSYCQSVNTSVFETETAPCPPQNVHADSAAVTASVTWELSNLTVWYTATAEGSDGHTATCTTSDTNCLIPDLHCSQTYSISVLAFGETCSSLQGSSYEIYTASCAPDEIIANVDCDSNRVVVSWGRTDGAISYDVTAEGSDGHTHLHNTTETRYEMLDLHCGQSYNIIVTTLSYRRHGISSTSIQIQTVPCDPQNVKVQLDCALNTALVLWDHSKGALWYGAVVEGTDGNNILCSTSESSCRTRTLLCGQLYHVYVVASDSACNHSVSPTVEIQTAPCSPQNVSAHLDCTARTTSVWWEQSEGAMFYTAIAEGMEGDRYSCNATAANCEILGLPCGQMYSITVLAMDEKCTSLPSPAFEIQAEPCIPQYVVAHINCENNTISVFWDPSNGSESYHVTAQGINGHWASCNTTGTECEVSDVHCGLNYYITVEAIRMECNSSQSSALTVKTVPCVPQNVDAHMDCDAGHMSVSWEFSEGAISYMATAEGSNVQQCSANDTLCDITDLYCGETYTLSVFAIDDTCDSAESPSITRRTASCIPQDVHVQLDCDTNDASVLWSHTKGAVSYSATAEGSDGHTVSCVTDNRECPITNLQCGQEYNVTLTARDGVCDNSQSPQIVFHTAPCAPEDISTSLNCDTKGTSVAWEESDGVMWYITTAEGQDGHISLCNTTGTSCHFMDLHCSQTYSLTVTAMDSYCQSVNTSVYETETAPCPPQNVQADSVGVTASVTWELSNLTVWYTATAEGSDGHTATCTTSDTNCLIPDLHCSQTYSISVLAFGETCSSLQGSSYEIHTAPCAPDEIITNVDCTSNRVVVSWGRTDGAIAYDVTAEGSDGHTHSDNTTDTRYEMLDLHCGQSYNITVTTLSYSRHGIASISVQIQTAPCIPENLTAELNCELNTISFWWDEADGAKLYTVTVRDSQRETASFNTSDTRAQTQELQCGEYYTISVLATDDICRRPQTAVVNVHAAPCSPQNVSAYLHCTARTTSVWWEQSEGAMFYTAMAEGMEGDRYSCNTTEANCEILGLPCGQWYNVTVLAMDENCTSLPSSAVEIQTVPCIPQSVAAYVNCENNTVSVFWDPSNGSESYHVTAQGINGHWASCNTTGTECEVSDVHCGLNYYITVEAIRMECNSSQSSALTIKTVPCVPQNVDAHMDCDAGYMSVSWEFSEGAISYMATAEGSNVQQCSANDTLCDITDLYCGETYTLSVYAIDDTCDSVESPSVTRRTVSCLPQNLDVQLDCDTNDASVLWSHTKGAVSYSATAEGNDGHTVSCETVNKECQISNLHCGQMYNLTLTALDGVCDNSQSSQFEFNTAPCAPEDISTSLNCDTKSTSVAWEESDGAMWYITTAEGQDGHISLCNTTGTSCDFMDLHCSQTYSLTVTAMDSYCQSVNTSVYETETAPCPPQNVQADSVTLTASVTWELSNLTVWYTATAEGTDGHTATCTTSDTNCLIPDLHCSQTYSISVLAFGETCSSLQSSSHKIHTAPCAPDEIITNVDCTSNRVVVSWGRTDGAIEYDVTAEGSDGHTHSDNTTDTRYEMLDLHCGQSYNMTVTTLSYSRHGIASTSAQIQTAPCIPENLTAELNCDMNTVSFWWDEADGAKLYTVTVRDSQRETTSFNTSDTRAQTQELQCGEYYTISVLATDDICRRPQTAVVNVHAVACDPHNVKAQLDCNVNTALVMWDSGKGALWYTAIAEGADGSNVSCSTSETSCRTPALLCGQLYSVHVVASDRTCNHSVSSSIEIQTAPCSPQSVSAHLDCTTRKMVVWWEQSEGAMFYMVMANGIEGEWYSCNTTEASCEIIGLPCGQMCNISVLAMDGNCTSLPSPTFEIQTEPCIPQDVVAQINCENNTISVFWDPSNGSESYHVTAQGINGHWASCNTTGTECEVSDVHCGLNYYITIEAIRMECNSSQSSAVTIKTVPCVPQNVDAHMDCDAGHMSVSWEFSEGAISYTATAEGSNVQQCSANDTLCDITDLYCGETYTLSVCAIDDTCDSVESPSVTMRTASCIAQNLDVQLDCNRNDAWVRWDHAKGASSYSATAAGGNGHVVSCETDSSKCQITNLRCGQMYNVTLVTLDGVCDNSQTPPFQFNTAPCAPEDISTSLNCDTKSTSVAWEESDGAMWYITTAEGQDGHISLCNTTGTSCDFMDLHCSQTYSLTVTAMDSYCQSVNTSVYETETAPCPPQNVHADSVTLTASVTWELSNLTVWYTATAEGSDGHTATCTTSDTNCLIPDLHCSQTYSISVLAFGETCSSLQSSRSEIYTAPCAPDEIITNVDCTSNRVVVSWGRTDGAIEYDVTAEGSDGHTHSDNTTDTRYEMLDLHCGQSYNITVTTLSYSRHGIASTSVQIQTAPCIPENLTAELNCELNTISFWWDEADGAKLYTVTVRDSQRETASFNTSDTRAQTQDLQCGEYYTISVLATDDICRRPQTAVVNVHAVACDPHNVKAQLDCNVNTALVMWDYSKGALWYTAIAEGADGSNVSCSSSETSCRTPAFLCGQLYSVHVVASDRTCNHSVSSSIEIQTAPCSPQSVSAHLDCTTRKMAVWWEQSEGAMFYMVMANGIEGEWYSCNTTEASCEIIGLPCGQMCNISVLAMDGNCTSLPSPTFEIQTEPCIPQDVVAQINCENNIISVFWDPSNGSESYHVTAQGINGHWASCNTTGTECEVSDVHCGLSYYITVEAIRMECNSSQSSAVTIKTVPCVPQNVDAHMDCDAGHMSVSWEFSEGAISYTATAEGSNVQQCSANDTLCDITDLYCGETYTLSVCAIDDTCDSAESPSVTMRTASCIAQNLDVQLDCNRNDAWVRWDHAKGASSYSATAAGGNGHVVSCETDSSKCQITNLRCGQMYNVTLVTLDGVCDNSQTPPFQFNTAPCAPEDISTSLNCDTKSTSVAWEESDGAMWYITTAEGQDGHISLCNTTGTSCEFMDLHCSQMYSLTVTAMDSYCQSVNTSIYETETAPCPPQNVQADSVGVTASVTWELSNLTVWYTATAEGMDGHTSTCTTSDTNCLIPDLHCSQTYSISVLAFGETCSSLQSSRSEIYTAPCAPDEIVTNVDCNSNRVVVSWGRSNGANEFDVTAEGSDGHTHSDNTTETHYEMLDLHCGQSYNITVTTLSYSRHGISSNSVQIQTAPCILENLSAEVTCNSNAISFTWNDTDGAKLYTVTIQDRQKVTASFNISDTRAQIPQPLCGEYYTISVLATDDVCKSPQSAVVNVQAGPCTPQGIAAHIYCNIHSVSASWEQKDGSDFYIATAEASDGHTQSCSAQEAACEILDLHCGQSYNITIVAVNEVCNSSQSPVIYVQTAPCIPEIISAQVDCDTNDVLVSWEQSKGSDLYLATAKATDEHEHLCNTVETTCKIFDLHCGQSYNITVKAGNEMCNSSESVQIGIQTGPCTPGNISAYVDCSTNAAVVSWEMSNGSDCYVATAIGNIEETHSCIAEDETCEIYGLQCGESYNVTVVAVNEMCNSSESTVWSFQGVPCNPQYLGADVDCANNSMRLSWDHVDTAISYMALVNASNKEQLHCDTTNTTCYIQHLSCATKYKVWFYANDGFCTSIIKSAYEVSTVPCAPEDIEVVSGPASNGVQELEVNWNDSHCAADYEVDITGQIEQDPFSMFTLRSYWTTRTFFQFPVPCSSTYDIFVTARNAAGISSPSVPLLGLTVPCPPTNLTAFLENGALFISWTESIYASEYIVCAASNLERNEICRTAALSCESPNVEYDTIEIVALNSAGKSEITKITFL
ncbi:uncharacterized protein LOC116977489 isoform X5 [Amblyraja radiata]|uniref:uncharacterized protein LOC116977489 isoform X5 n=1 Tax=Amblyraja radiata TaxID=386614 RepID=UPI0014027E21|nr:uncharacterized protein LOC116977489 isoform X5 [Amblyraja radiata]